MVAKDRLEKSWKQERFDILVDSYYGSTTAMLYMYDAYHMLSSSKD